MSMLSYGKYFLNKALLFLNPKGSKISKDSGVEKIQNQWLLQWTIREKVLELIRIFLKDFKNTDPI